LRAPDGARPHPKGVGLAGAWIDGELDLEGVETQLYLTLGYCLFPQQPTLRDAHLGGLFFGGSPCESGLFLHRLTTAINVHLREGFHCSGLFDLTEAQIGVLRDDAEAWKVVGEYHLSGFHYDRLHGPLSLSMRRDWLKKKHAAVLTGPKGRKVSDFDPPALYPSGQRFGQGRAQVCRCRNPVRAGK